MGILCYHTVDEHFRSRLSLTPAQFDEHCRWLAADRDVVDLETAVELMDDRGRLPRGVVALTFDDGLEGIYRHVYPTLVRHGLPATVFLVADTLTGAHPVVDWIDGTPPGVLRTVTPDQVLEMAGEGLAFGSHSARHLDLPALGATRCEVDLRRSREVLEELLGVPVPALAYPRGRHDATVRLAARRAGFVVAYGLPEARESWGPMAVPRIGVYAHNHLPTVRLKTARAYLGIRTGRLYPAVRRVARTTRRRPSAPRPVVDTTASRPTPDGTGHVAHVMSRFPKISETFVLDEILELRRRGVRVDVHPLLRERQPVSHPEAAALVREARFQPFLSRQILTSQVYFLRRRPVAYLRMVRDVLRGTAGSLNFFVGAIGILPKVVHMARCMHEDGVEHVHCHFATHPAVAGLIVSRLTGIPFSFTAHGSDLHVDRRMLDVKVAEASFVVAVSEYNREVIRRTVPAAHHGKVHVVHCGVDLRRFEPAPVRDTEGPLRVLCIGTLHEVKGQSVLLEATGILRDRGVPVVCHLVGDGPDRRMLEARVRTAGLDHQVQLLGALPRDAVVAQLLAADVLVAPSVPTARGKREGIPVVLMEAMAMARPVVASRLSGIPELVDDGVTGLLTEPGDAVAVADALARLADDLELRRRLGEAGRRRVEADFSLAGCVELLHALMGRGARAPRA